MQVRGLVLALAATVVVAACGDKDTTAPVSKILNFRATMTPAGEPTTLNGNPTGSGTFTATLDTSTNVFTWTGSFTGLTSNINNGHIHGPFPVGQTTPNSAGVLINFNPAATQTTATGLTFAGLNAATAGSVAGSITLSNAGFNLNTTVTGDSIRKLIIAGATYVNIHTTSNGSGEIRGQLARVP